MTHVPSAAAPGTAAALAGDIQILFDTSIRAAAGADGKLNGLCVTTRASDSGARAPTMRESAPEAGKFDVSSWFGVFLRRRRPRRWWIALSRR